MVVDTSLWTASDYAAWWGAVVATAAFIWQAVRELRSGPRIRVRASPNVIIFPKRPPLEGTYISVTAVNLGTATTTVTHFVGFCYLTRWSCFRRKRQHFAIPTGLPIGKSLPCVLGPGEEWSNMIDQDDLEAKMKPRYLYVGVIHNQRRRPVYVRVRLNKPARPEPDLKLPAQ
jgi:hypothetical protein